MRQAQNKNDGSVIRWLLIVVGAVVIGGVLVNAVWLHLYYPRLPAPRHAARGRIPTIPQKWQFTTSGPITGSLALGDDGTLYAASEDGFLYAVDASGTLQWKFNAGAIQASPVIGADGTIYVTNEDQRIFAINRAGAQQWAAGGGPYADKQMGSVTAAIDQEHLYTPWRGLLRAIRLADGSFDWPAGYGFQRGGSIIMLPNELIVYTDAGRLSAVDSTGRTQWQYPVMNPPVTTDLLLKNGGHIPVGNFWLDSPMAVGYDGTIYLCAVDSRLIALTPEGSVKWEFKTKTRSVNRASPVIAADATIYFASGDATLYALQADGTQKWALDMPGGSISATPMIAADETIYVVSGSTLVAVSPEGKLLEEAPLDGTVASSPTLAPDGTVYAASRSGKIIAFAGKHGGLLSSPWPKFQAGLANSGRARRF